LIACNVCSQSYNAILHSTALTAHNARTTNSQGNINFCTSL